MKLLKDSLKSENVWLIITVMLLAIMYQKSMSVNFGISVSNTIPYRKEQVHKCLKKLERGHPSLTLKSVIKE